MSGYRVRVTVEVRPNAEGYSPAAAVVSLERAELVARHLSGSLDHPDQTAQLSAPVSAAVFEAAREAVRQLEELGATLGPQLPTPDTGGH